MVSSCMEEVSLDYLAFFVSHAFLIRDTLDYLSVSIQEYTLLLLSGVFIVDRACESR